MAKPERLENHLVFLFLIYEQINVENIFTYSTEQIVPIMHILKKMPHYFRILKGGRHSRERRR